MHTTIALIDALKRRHGLKSDYELAKHLSLTRAAVSHYRSGRNSFDDLIALRVADELGLSRAAVLAAMAGERSRHDDVRRTWRDAVKRLGGVAAAALLAMGGGPTPPSAGAAVVLHNVPQYTIDNKRRRQRAALGVLLRWLAALFAPLAIAACATTIDEHRAPPADWPHLTVYEHPVLVGELYDHCAQYVPVWMKAVSWLTLTPPIVNGCAVVDFDNMRCDIYRRGDLPDVEVDEHELEHCAGRDHTEGEPTLANAWAAYKARMLEHADRYVYIRADGQQVSIRKPYQ